MNAVLRLPLTIVLAVFAIVPLSYCILFLDIQTIIWLGNEDGIIEYLGAGFFFLAALLFAVAAWRVQSQWPVAGKGANGTWFLVLMAVLSFLCLGEEISWGQRIIGWQTPEFIAAINVQDETSIHNLFLFQKMGGETAPLEWLNATRLLALTLGLLFIVLPLSNATSSWLRTRYSLLGILVPPLWLGLLLVFIYIVFRSMVGYLGAEHHALDTLNELKETHYGYVLALYGTWAYGHCRFINKSA